MQCYINVVDCSWCSESCLLQPQRVVSLSSSTPLATLNLRPNRARQCRQLLYNKVFQPDYVGFSPDGAKYLVDALKVELVGLDYLTIASYDSLVETHKILLEKVWRVALCRS